MGTLTAGEGRNSLWYILDHTPGLLLSSHTAVSQAAWTGAIRAQSSRADWLDVRYLSEVTRIVGETEPPLQGAPD